MLSKNPMIENERRRRRTEGWCYWALFFNLSKLYIRIYVNNIHTLKIGYKFLFF